MRRISLCCVILATWLLAGCTTYRASDRNQFYLSLEYAPISAAMIGDNDNPRLSDVVDWASARPRNPALDDASGCNDLGVLPDASRYLGDPSDSAALFTPPKRTAGLRPLPGMMLDVGQMTARGRAAADVPGLDTWTWRVPRPAGSGCGDSLARLDIIIERGLVFGARGIHPADPNRPARFLGWQSLVSAAATDLPADDMQAELTLRKRLFDALPAGLYVTYRTNEPYSPTSGPPAPQAPPVGGVTRETGLARAFATLEKLSYASLKGNGADDLARCADPDKWNATTREIRRPDGRCGYTVKALQLDVHLASAPINLTLLSDGDDFLLAQPRVVDKMFDGAFDTNVDQAPGSAPNPQRPHYGDAFLGFTDFTVRIPVRVEGEAAPRWVSAATTVATFEAETGLAIRALRRAAYWVDKTIMVERSQGSGWIKQTLDQAKFRDGDGRIRFHFDTAKTNASIAISGPDALVDFLLAPGDQLIPIPAPSWR